MIKMFEADDLSYINNEYLIVDNNTLQIVIQLLKLITDEQVKTVKLIKILVLKV